MEQFTFNEETHEYRLGDKILPSVTTILEATLFEKKYAGVSEETLRKAAERGTIIHKEIENYIKHEEIGFTEELGNFIEIEQKANLQEIQSEIKIHNEEMAGTIDIFAKMGNEQILADIKTTYKLDKEYVSWQLSFYAYIIEHTTDITIDALYGIWLREEEYEFVKVERKSDKQIEDVLEAYKNGVKIDFNTTTLQTIPKNTQIDFCAYMKQIKAIEEKTAIIKEAILKEMEERGIPKIDLGDVTITYKAPSTRDSVDSKKLKEDGLYEKYIKTSNVKSSITIKVKEEK